jgi:hypothetical protein
LKAWTIFIAPSTFAGDRSDIGDAVLAVLGDGAHAAGPRIVSGRTISAMPTEHHGRELGAEDEQDHGAGGSHHAIARDATETVVPTDLFDDGRIDR